MLGSGNQAALLKDKRIRIITVSEIRYEGTLYQINTKDKTIALKNVVAFGTEDRKADQVIPPSQNVYELINFKASHIKDINVLTSEEEKKAQVVKEEEEEEPKQVAPVEAPKTQEPKIQKVPEREVSREKRKYDDDEDEYEPKGSSSRGRGYHRDDDRDRYGGHNGYRRTQGPRDGGNRRTEKGPKDFDFEEMVEKNNLLEKEKGDKKEDDAEKYNFDDFFDTMSTSVNDKGEGGKRDPYHQYKTNTETFGFQKRQNHRGGPRGRGGHHRGGYQGGDRGERDHGYDNRRGGYRRENDRDREYYPRDGVKEQAYPRGGRGGGFRGKRNDYDDGDKFYEKKN
jgi:protein LSM14